MPGNVLLCDLDGTLVDKDAGFRLWADAFAATHGLTPEQRHWLDEADRLHRQRELFFQAVVGHLSLDEPAGDVWADYRKKMPDLTPVMPGVVSALASLRDAGWLLAVVSNGKSDNQRGKLAVTGLAPLFHAVVISEEAGCRKPDPAIFAAALGRFTTDQPRAEWLIGDDPTLDVRGGSSAGLNTIWVSGGREWQEVDCAPTATFPTTAEGLAHLLQTAP